MNTTGLGIIVGAIVNLYMCLKLTCLICLLVIVINRGGSTNVSVLWSR